MADQPIAEATEERSASQWVDDLRAMQAAPITTTVELTEGTSQPVEFLRIGVFTDANGREVEIDDARLNAIIAGFETGAAGQDIPIDILHERKEAAGWVSHIYREGDRLLARPEWNELGRRLVGDKVYRYLSATVDITRNVLRSISLVNFPAIKGLRPVELSDPLAPPSQDDESTGPATATPAPIPEHTEVSMADEKTVDVEAIEPATPPNTPASAVLSEQDKAALRKSVEAELRTALLAEFAQIEQSKARMMAELMEQVRDERDLSEFAHKATAEGRNALPMTKEDLLATLSELPKPYRSKVIALLRTITENGTVDFTEHGTSRGKAPGKLDAETTAAIRSFIAHGGSVDTFFEANPELGAKADYNLEIGG